MSNNRKDLVNGLIISVALGALFTFFQAYEYSHAAFGFAGNIYGASFFMATGFHGFHVLIGSIFLTVCLIRALKGHFTPEQHVGFEAAAWYWHFVGCGLAVPFRRRLRLGRLLSPWNCGQRGPLRPALFILEFVPDVAPHDLSCPAWIGGLRHFGGAWHLAGAAVWPGKRPSWPRSRP